MIAVRWQRVEGALVFAGISVVFLAMWPVMPWWAALLVFFAPDLSFAAYLAGPRIGAVAYNAVHMYGTGVALMALGFFSGSEPVLWTGVLWMAHAGFDRMFGYGLKSPESFNETHLGRIGRP